MRIIIILLLFVFIHVSADTVYKTVDEYGNVIYTDKPSKDAEELQIDELQTIENPRAGDYRYKPYQKKQQAVEKYTSITISNPANDSPIRDNAGNLTIKIAIEPALKGSDQIEISMDGTIVYTGSGSSTALSNVDRGTHTLVAKVVDASGKVLKSSSPVTVHILRYR